MHKKSRQINLLRVYPVDDHKGQETRIQRALDKARKDFSQQGKNVFTPEECKKMKGMADTLRGKKKSPDKEYQIWISNLSKVERKDGIKSLEAVEALCGNFTEENFLNFVRVAFEKESRSCTATIVEFQQTFRLYPTPYLGHRLGLLRESPQGHVGLSNLHVLKQLQKAASTGITFPRKQ